MAQGNSSQSIQQALRVKAMDYVNDGVMIAGPDGKIVYLDTSMGRMLGINPDALHTSTGEDISASLQFSGGFNFKDLIREVDTKGQWTGEATIIRDGDNILLEIRASRLTDSSAKPMGTIFVARDVTKERTLEKQVLQSQQMELVDNLSIGIAHEFKNLLTVIMAYSSLLESQMHGNPLQKDITKILETAEKANELTARLLSVTRRGEPYKIHKVEVHKVIEDVISMLKKSLTPNVTLFAPEKIAVPSVMIDPAILTRAILNLCLNARDAMPNGGSLTIEVDSVQVEKEDLVQWPDRNPGSYITISVTDTGHGMTQEVKHQIFDPFFSTRKSGTGLGLSVVQHTIKTMGGWITVYAEPGIGACFRLYLPAAVQSDKDPLPDEPLSFTGNENILVIDDDPLVLNITQRFLERSGYKVLLAGGGEEGIKIYREKGSEVDLVLLDVVMPHMNGEEVYRELQRINPRVSILVVSGFSPKTAEKLLKISGARMLSKPFTRARITREIRNILDKEIHAV